MNYLCLTCGAKFMHVRGCCKKCYPLHRLAVLAGETTWEELEQQGKSRPPQTKAERDRLHSVFHWTRRD
jgi:predicted ATP-dependent serine protease